LIRKGQSAAEILTENKIGPKRARAIVSKFPRAKVIGIGRHSVVLRQGKTAIKVQKETPAASTAIADEAHWLGFLNKHDIGPRLMKHNRTLQYVTYLYVTGKFFPQFIASCSSKARIKRVLRTCIFKCRVMDDLNVNKEEMHRPLKHIIVGKSVKFIDFERCSKTKNPKNVTQFCNYIFITNNPVATKVRKLFGVRKDDALRLLKSYKKKRDLEPVISLLN
jgi:predicted Ser/Thr protein kinase